MRLIIMAASVIALNACGGNEVDADGDGAISENELKAAADEMVRPEPGRYRTTVSLVDIEMPGAPPQAREAMKSAMQTQTSESCLTQEDADRGFEQMTQNMQNANCKYEKFEMDGSNIDARAVCDADAGTMDMTMTGTAGRTSSDMTMTMKGNMTGMGEGRMTMRIQNERIGDCT